MTKEYWNNKHDSYYAKKDWTHKPSLFAEFCVQYFPKKGKILDIGTGQGQDARYFQSLGYKVVATDYSSHALKNAQTNIPNVQFIEVDTASGLPFDDATFDVVYSHMALHYFDDETTKKVFSDIYRILKPAGIFAILTNTMDDPERLTEGYSEIEQGFYHSPDGIVKRYFDVNYMRQVTENLFETIVLDNKGETYKDDLATLIRFIGKKI